MPGRHPGSGGDLGQGVEVGCSWYPQVTVRGPAVELTCPAGQEEELLRCTLDKEGSRLLLLRTHRAPVRPSGAERSGELGSQKGQSSLPSGIVESKRCSGKTFPQREGGRWPGPADQALGAKTCPQLSWKLVPDPCPDSRPRRTLSGVLAFYCLCS